MEVVAHEPYSWFLLREGDKLFLDVNCNHSAVGYTWLIELNSVEHQLFNEDGESYIHQLADRIQHSAPIVEGSSSPFADRNVDREYREEVSVAVKKWREEKK